MLTLSCCTKLSIVPAPSVRRPKYSVEHFTRIGDELALPCRRTCPARSACGISRAATKSARTAWVRPMYNSPHACGESRSVRRRLSAQDPARHQDHRHGRCVGQLEPAELFRDEVPAGPWLQSRSRKPVRRRTEDSRTTGLWFRSEEHTS